MRYAIASLAILTTCATATPPRYTAERVSEWTSANGTLSHNIRAIDGLGRVFGNEVGPDIRFYATRWDSSGSHRTPIDGDIWYSSAEGVNEQGVAVGAILASDAEEAFVWDDTGVRTLPVPDRSFPQPRSISSSGVIYGTIQPEDDILPVRWINGVFEKLPTPGPGHCEIRGSNDDGFLVAQRYSSSAGTSIIPHLARWTPNGTWTELTAPDPAEEVWASSNGLSDAGEVAGNIGQRTGPTRAAIWDLQGVARLLPLLPGDTASKVHTLAPSGMAFGESSRGEEWTSVLWADGQAYPLNSLIDGEQPESFVFFCDVNQAGQIACLGSRVESDGAQRNSVWVLTPIPAPGGLGLMGLATLAIRRRRA
jgi:hypothetical protein